MNRTLASRVIAAAIALVVFPLASTAGAQTYSVTNLNLLAGEQYSRAYSINGSGQVAGNMYVETDLNDHAFMYSGGTVSNLGSLGGSSTGWGINSSGQIAGFTWFNSLDSSDVHAFLYSGGVMNDLNTLGGSNSYGFAINDSGQVVGDSDTAGGDDHAFIYSGGVMNDLNTLGGSDSFAYGINNSGQITGDSLTAGGDDHAYIYSAGTMTDLGTLAGLPISYGSGINDSGVIVGSATTSDGTGAHAWIYNGGPLVDLGASLPGLPLTYGDGINNSGVVVGAATSADASVSHAMVDISGTMYDLNDLISPASGWVLAEAWSINDSGQIVGYGYYNGDTYHAMAFLLTPVPEPSTLVLAALGGIALVIARRPAVKRARSSS